MRNQCQQKVLRCALAVVLACGLSIPTTAISAYADGENAPTPPLASEATSDGGAFDAPVDDVTTGETGEPAEGEGSPAEGDVVAPSAPDAPSEPADVPEKVPSAAPDPDSAAQAVIDAATSVFAAGAMPAAAGGTPSPQADDGPQTLGGLVVSGGVNGTDYQLVGNSVQVLTDTPLTIKNANPAASTTTNIVIPAGVKANVILAGVNIAGSSGSPINMITNLRGTATGAAATDGSQVINKTTLHLTLADGSVNTLNALNVASYPGLRCGEGSVLVVDDSRLNIDSAGNPVVPQDGKVGFDGTLLDGTAVKADDLLTVMESANPGSLTCYGGDRSSGIGGGAYERGGHMTFEGGIIAGYGYQHTTQSDSVARTGAGIGGGINGGGTEMYFNGGRITAHGAYHSAGIGAGYGNQQYVSGGAPAPDAIARPRYSISATFGGNIYINGGFIQSTGGSHGNAFGAGCVSNNANHVIKVTGGTLLPTSPSGKDIGGGGGYVIITGGSVRVSGPTKFDGIGGTAYNTEGVTTWEDITSQPGGALPDDDKVQMITVDLSPDIGKVDYRISHWELYVNGEKRDYGAPAYLDKGLLYLWLSAEDSKKPVEVRLSYLNDKNEQVEVEPIETRPTPGGGAAQAKRWIKFELDESKFPGGLVKPYDGLPIEKWELSKNPVTVTTSTSTRDLDDDTFVTFSYQFINADGTLSESFSNGSEMPADTGKMKFVMQSTQYANDAELSKTYWGHETEGVCQITPVPAVLTLEESSWVRLDETTGSYELVKETDTVPGNRLRLVFDIRSAIGTAVTCKAPTGKFQVMIDGKPVGEPIALTEEAVKASVHSEFSITEGPTDKAANTAAAMASKDGRWKTSVTYYLDPTKLDGKLDLLETGGQNREHQVTVQYIPDKNYVEGTEANPENEASKPTTIVPVKPEGSVGTDPDGPTVDVEESPKPTPNPDGTDPADPTGKMTVIRKTLTASYGDFHQKDNSDLADFFALALDSTSASPATYTVSNTAVADLIPGEDGKPSFDDKRRLKVQINSCGTSVITVEQKPNALYTGIKYILTVNVTPDPSIRPQVQIRLTQRNLTALAEAAGAQVAAFSLAAFPAASGRAGLASPAAVRAAADRTALPPRPGDVIEYTVTGLNLTPGSAWQGAELVDAIDARLTFDAASVEVAPNYATRTDKSTALGTAAFYDGFDWDGLDWDEVAKGDYAFSASTLSKKIGTVYGGQSTSVRFNATVPENENLGDRPSGDALPEIKNEPGGTGGYGKPEDGLDPGETAEPATPLPPENIVVVGDDAKPDPADPDNPQPAEPGTVGPTPVLPKDPAAADIETTVKVEHKESFEEHDDDRILVGDILTVTATSTNKAPDSKLANAVIKVTLPTGMDLKPGTIELTDAQGNKYQVPDSAYDPVTGVVAVNAGDLYGLESAELTFEVEVTSTSATRPPTDGSDPRPSDPPIEGGTLGETPTDEWEREHPEGTDPDNPPATSEEPKPGTPFVPTKPWPEIEDELVSTPPATDPDMPPVLPSSPSTEDKGGSKADISVTKTAANVSRDDGTTRVGDTVRYTVVLANAKEHSMWYDAIIRDELPRGLDFIAGSAKITGADGTEHEVPDSAWDGATRVLAVKAGDLPGGTSVTLVFDALVTEAAIGADIGNVASAHGTTPGEVDPDSVTPGAKRPTPGEPFKPSEGWDKFLREHPGVDNADEPAYAPGTDAKGGVKPADKKPLAQTGDDVWALVGLPLLLCAATAAAMVLCLVRRGREEGAR